MAKGKIAFPLDSLTGNIQGNDRTIGRDKGFVATIRDLKDGVSGDNNMGATSQLVSMKAPTRGGSTARHTRAEIYCNCDKFYASLTVEKRSFLEPWWKAVSDRGIVHMSAHSVLMKICLKNLIEFDVFPRMSWCSRYSVTNPSDLAWSNKEVILTGIPTYQADGMDLEVYKLLIMTTKKGTVTYDPRMIDIRLVHDVYERGKATVRIPALPPGASMLVDVYSYYKPEV
jgi:hypothetical protein